MAILEVALAGLFMTVLMVAIYLARGIDPVTPLWLASTTASLITAVKANWAGRLFHSFVVPVLVAIMAAHVERRGWLADAWASGPRRRILRRGPRGRCLGGNPPPPSNPATVSLAHH